MAEVSLFFAGDKGFSHGSYFFSSLSMLVQHHCDGAGISRHSPFLHLNKKMLFLFTVVTAISKVSEEINQTLNFFSTGVIFFLNYFCFSLCSLQD
jgi:hypothetical protein